MANDFPKHCLLCGGCDIATKSCERALEDKVLKVKSQYKISEIHQGPNLSYRSRAYFRARVFKHQKSIKLGYFKRNSREFLEINYCPILMSPLNDFITLCSESTIVTECFTDDLKFRLMVDILKDKYGNYSLNIEISGYKEDNERLNQVKHSMSLFSIVDQVVISSEKSVNMTQSVKDFVDDVQFYHMPGDFSQPQFELNDLVRLMILEKASNLQINSLTELFSGNGNFSLLLAKKLGISVKGYEQNESAVACANRSADELGLDASYEVMNLYNQKKWNLLDLSGELILADPPRAGLGEVARNISSRYIFYISCSFKSLYKDVADNLIPNGYTLKDLCAIDMMPYTQHLEFLAILEKQIQPL